MSFTFQVLGQIGVRCGPVPVELPAGKPQSLLAALLLNANRLVPVQSLVDALWDEAPPRSAVANVRTYAVRVRKLLADPETAAGSRLLGLERAYRIAVQPGELDLADFTELAAQGRASLRAGDATRAVERLIAALACWRDDHACVGLLRLGGLGQRLAALDDERLRTAEDLVDARLALNHHEVLIGELRRTVVEHPLRERSWGQLMRALYRAGDVSGALHCFLDARAALQKEIGVDPGPELRRLHAAMLARDPTLDEALQVGEAQPQPPPQIAIHRPRPEPPRQLPPGPAVLVGRDQAANSVMAAVDTGARIVCIYGPPGAGTSAFAVHAAHLLAPQYPDGQLFVQLGAADTVAVAAHLLHSLGVADEAVPRGLAARTARLRTAFAGRRVLLLVDGVDDVAQVRPLLPAGQGCLAVVAGSRPLPTLDGAALVPLEPLPPSDAVALLRQSLGEERAGAEDPEALREIVDWCDGLPMALRIVVARMQGRPDRSARSCAQRLREPQRRLDELRAHDLSIRESLAARCATVSATAIGALRALAGLPGRVTAQDLAAASALSIDRTRDVLDELLDAQLVTTDGEGGHHAGSLVRLFASRQAQGMINVDV
ncbi:BTAD domain-containing putative transcriptional regulator [Dactylosporangium sp. NPDC048998]|uniref:AfsR/SARP family transcriptional regulator n=1 Tax=Dactylosporangium sp. NPDC048998 TaxID=3363976 RepID=UPI00371E9312